jgi:hypothetical protein
MIRKLASPAFLLHKSRCTLIQLSGTSCHLPHFQHQLSTTSHLNLINMKRSRNKANGEPKAKKQKIKVPDYETSHEPVQDENGEIIWPAPEAEMEAARAFIRKA